MRKLDTVHADVVLSLAADRMGPDELLLRLNEDSVLAWLTAKVERATKRFTELATSRARGGGAGGDGGGGDGFAKGFAAITAPDGTGQEEIAAECKQEALGAVCEYLDEEWARKLADKFRYGGVVRLYTYCPCEK